MNTKAVLYLSKAQVSFNDEAVQNLYQKSYKNNLVFKLSGFLCFKDELFLQYIEGEEQHINALLTRIKEDKRHKIIVCLEDSHLQHQRFSKWNMHLVNTQCIDELEISFTLYEQLLMLEGRETISQKVQNLVWQGVGVVAMYHADLRR